MRKELTSPRGKFIEKILRDENGHLVRATFCIYEEAGRIKARLLHAVIIADESIIKNSTLSLPGFSKKDTFSCVAVCNSITSPYISSSLLYFSGSKPRAPTQF